MSESQAPAVIKPRASQALSILTGMEPAMMLDTVKAQCFKGDPARVTDTQLAAFVSIAAEMGINPLLPGMIYAFPVQGGGIVPMIGPDGVFKKLSEHPNVDSWKTTVYPEDVTQPPTHATTEIFLRNSERPLTYTALLSEWKVAQNPNWNSRPRHMLNLRALKQAARQVIHGVPYDEDERAMMGMIDVGPGAPGAEPEQSKRPPAPRKAKGAASVIDVVQEPTSVTVATPVAEPTPIAEAAPAFTEPAAPAEPAPAAQPKSTVTAQPGQPRAFLSDAEEIECEVTVTEFAGIFLKKGGKEGIPAVKAVVKGGYNGTVYDLNGGEISGDDVMAKAPWALSAKLKVKLLGEKSKSGTVIPYVVKVEGVQEEL